VSRYQTETLPSQTFGHEKTPLIGAKPRCMRVKQGKSTGKTNKAEAFTAFPHGMQSAFQK